MLKHYYYPIIVGVIPGIIGLVAALSRFYETTDNLENRDIVLLFVFMSIYVSWFTWALIKVNGKWNILIHKIEWGFYAIYIAICLSLLFTLKDAVEPLKSVVLLVIQFLISGFFISIGIIKYKELKDNNV
ncbi:MAG: hypothetical protein HY869_09890 [Chloroflexi bacterium]|nr:hypothetical protein [Chloroflexota bacterium]